jgi:antitoxin component of MazEF toxin-antitoxin module
MEIELKRRGNSLGFWIPKEVLEEGSQLVLEEGRLFVRSSKKARLQKLLGQLEARGSDPQGELARE